MPTVTYRDDATMGAARAAYFAANGFDESGYADKWVKLQAGPVPIFLPNSPQRVRAVRLHDLHHVVTGYDTTWTGEAEIAAWEIASSCADHYAAWLLNLEAMAVGLVLAPGAVFRAFVRGRYSQNFYRTPFAETMLAPTVAATRARLRLDRATPAASPADWVAFVGWTLAASAAFVTTALVVFSPFLGLAAYLTG